MENLQLAFDEAKAALPQATLLAHPDPGAPIALTTDTSAIAVGAVLEQIKNSGWQPLAFFSQKLRPPQLKYSAFDRELLAVYLAIRHFCYYLEGWKFTIYTDHKPLMFASTCKSDPWSVCQLRHLAYIAEYTSDIQHLAGKDNKVSRATIATILQASTSKRWPKIRSRIAMLPLFPPRSPT